MTFTYEPALLEYMQKKGKNTIVVEEVTINNSDIEITELHIHLIDDKRAEEFISKKRYRSTATSPTKNLFTASKTPLLDVITPEYYTTFPSKREA